MSMNHGKAGPGLHRQRGQSLIEMAVALIVLVPLAAGITVLGQYIHVKQQTQAAARQAAWAAAVDSSLIAKGLPDQNKQQEALRARIFGDSAAPLRSDARAPDALADTMLTTFAGNPLVKPGDLRLKVYSQEAAPSYLDQGIGMIGKVTGHLPPNDKGLITAEVATGTQQITDRDGDPLAFLDVLATRKPSFSARTVLLADAWDAAGAGEKADGSGIDDASPRSVRKTIQPLVPGDWIGGVNDVLKTFAKVLGSIPIVNKILTPGLDQYKPGRTAPDVVPVDKLVKYANTH